MKNFKKFKYLLLIVLIVSVALCACGKKKNKNADNQYEEDYEWEDDEDYFDESEDELYDYEEYDVVEDYTLDDIALLNGLEVEQLNVLWGNNGGIVFLGDKYGEELVTNEDEALASLEHVKTLAQLDGVELQYNRTDISPVTGNVIYTFYQTSKTTLDGEEITAKFYNSLIKVITDSDGNLRGVSADIVPASEMDSIDEIDVISKDEAIEYVKNLINDDRRRIYDDITEYAFWDDEGTVLGVNSNSKVSPAWFVYTDAELGNNASKPYEVFVVSLSPGYSFDEDEEYYETPEVLSKYYVETLDIDDTLDVYTSVFYFDGMKDAGEYTYEVNLDWVKKYYKDYKGPKKETYTVPVMYSEKEDLYYLGDFEKKITLSNYYDFGILDTTNAYVTKTPEDINSWHFQLDKAEDGSSGKYFNNPNYVISSFAVMCDTWNDFYERYGLDSVDGTGLPTMLCVYAMDGYEYPDNEKDFLYNAFNMGQDRDWQVMATSIVLPSCLEHEVMSHEYTHGINGQLTMSQYFNGAGAVMESYADIIGEQMSMVNEYPECTGEFEWHIGGDKGVYMRNMSNPYEFKSPMYIGGNYYLNPVSEVISQEFDAGGVHTNSSILNYLAYCLVNGTGEGNDEATLSIDENLDMWFDTLYYTNHQTDYYDVATYLTLSAETMGLDEDKYLYLRQLLVDFGLIPDAEGETYVSFEEDSDLYNINVRYDDSNYSDLADVFKLGFIFYDDEDNYLNAGGLSEDGSITYAVEKGTKLGRLEYVLGNEMTEECEYYTFDDCLELPHNMDIFFTALDVYSGEGLTTDPGYELLFATPSDDAEIEVVDNEDGSMTMYVEGSGTVVATLKNQNESSEDYGKYSIYVIESE